MAAAFPIMIFAARPDFSEIERRPLTSFPEFTLKRISSGDFTRELNLFFSDTVPMRDSLAGMSSLIKSRLGFSVDGVTLHDVQLTVDNEQSEADNEPTDGQIGEIALDNPEPAQLWDGVIDVSANAVDEAADEAVELSSAGVLVYRNRALMLIGWVSSAGERYADVVSEYSRRLDGVDVYSMVIPSAIEFYCPKNYLSHYNIDQRASINNINAHLSNVTPVNVYSSLAERVAAGDDIFFRTDHHWAPLGAFYAAEQFAQSAGVPFATLSDYQKVVIPGYVGTMYGYSGRNPDILNNPEDFVYFKPINDNYTSTYYITHEGYNPEAPVPAPLFIEQPLSESYSIFLGSDARITHISTNVDNSRKLAVFKDSFGNALIPFLTASFEEIYVIDIRYFPYNAIDYLAEKGITDVLFANNIAMANDGYFITTIENLMNN